MEVAAVRGGSRQGGRQAGRGRWRQHDAAAKDGGRAMRGPAGFGGFRSSGDGADSMGGCTRSVGLGRRIGARDALR